MSWDFIPIKYLFILLEMYALENENMKLKLKSAVSVVKWNRKCWKCSCLTETSTLFFSPQMQPDRLIQYIQHSLFQHLQFTYCFSFTILKHISCKFLNRYKVRICSKVWTVPFIKLQYPCSTVSCMNNNWRD